MRCTNKFFIDKSFGIKITLIVIITIFTLTISVFAKGKIPIYSVERDDKKIALTFDVNWAEKEHIYEILDLLDENNIKATFFVMGKWIIYPEGNKEKLIEINKRGHEIGNHSYSHPDFKNIGKERIIEEVKKTEDIIKNEIGIKTNLFRFPSGSYRGENLQFIEDLGYKSIQWDVDSVDWKGESKEKEFKRVMNNVKSGSILLYHNDGKYTVDNLKEIIPKLKADGYEFVKVSEIIYENSYEIDDNGKQLLIKQKQNNS
ncbi:polysaccharide deacetylase family sporulation protein PdaB [Clostridium sp. LIBA-8841]|uniref:polysaccharide deacetylase family sporulation protein PdaB n=1 Tax=Clostridium sp. LIBA-8841 TaxID=2987530 RepID=UPI002AC64898|nr:polysaccharide deacetylase family sporulation protein PdaB [Clostridium sp. LIBA-8841]MDZ5252854.1 polysaccharide deacetylase family sporulation protein PdaB [Clostridium sp. LIBA-8841]